MRVFVLRNPTGSPAARVFTQGRSPSATCGVRATCSCPPTRRRPDASRGFPAPRPDLIGARLQATIRASADRVRRRAGLFSTRRARVLAAGSTRFQRRQTKGRKPLPGVPFKPLLTALHAAAPGNRHMRILNALVTAAAASLNAPSHVDGWKSTSTKLCSSSARQSSPFLREFEPYFFSTTETRTEHAHCTCPPARVLRIATSLPEPGLTGRQRARALRLAPSCYALLGSPAPDGSERRDQRPPHRNAQEHEEPALGVRLLRARAASVRTPPLAMILQ